MRTQKTDPLYICNPKEICQHCKNNRRRRKRCEPCKRTGFAAINLAGQWAPRPGFLVCGGPSLKNHDPDVFRQRGVMSCGVNNASAYAGTTAAVFGDPQWKFHSSIFDDPKTMVFAPNAKLGRHVRMQDPITKQFYFSDRTLGSCPNVYGLCRSGRFFPETFFTEWRAHWGKGGKMEGRDFSRLATMLLGLRVLHYLGCRTVYLVGVDFWMSKEEPYAWGGNRTGGNKIWRKISSMLDDLRKPMEEQGLNVFNCNPASKLESFLYVSFESAIHHATLPFGTPPYDLSQWYESGTMKEHQAAHPELLARYVV